MSRLAEFSWPLLSFRLAGNLLFYLHTTCHHLRARVSVCLAGSSLSPSEPKFCERVRTARHKSRGPMPICGTNHPFISASQSPTPIALISGLCSRFLSQKASFLPLPPGPILISQDQFLRHESLAPSLELGFPSGLPESPVHSSPSQHFHLANCHVKHERLLTIRICCPPRPPSPAQDLLAPAGARASTLCLSKHQEPHFPSIR